MQNTPPFMSSTGKKRDAVANPLPPRLHALLGERVVAFRMHLVNICDGDQVAGLFLAQGLYWTERTDDPDRWFYKSGKQWEEEIGLSRHQRDRVRKLLAQKGFLRYRRAHRTPGVLEYQLILSNIEAALVKLVGNHGSLSESDKLDDRKTTDHQLRSGTSSLPESVNPDASKAADQSVLGGPSSMSETVKRNKEAEITSENTPKSTPESFPDVFTEIFPTPLPPLPRKGV